jgi:hypothetical protein
MSGIAGHRLTQSTKALITTIGRTAASCTYCARAEHANRAVRAWAWYYHRR